MSKDIEFATELARIGHALSGPDKEHVLAAADHIARLASEVGRLQAALELAPKPARAQSDVDNEETLRRYRSVYGTSLEHPG